MCKKASDNYQVYVMKVFFTTLILYTFCGYENSINLNFRIIRAVRNVRNLFPVKTISRISKKITEISVKLSLILNVPSLLNMIIKNVLFSVWVRRALWGRVQPTRLRWWIAHHLLLSNLLLLQGLWRQRKKMLLKVISRFHFLVCFSFLIFLVSSSFPNSSFSIPHPKRNVQFP